MKLVIIFVIALLYSPISLALVQQEGSTGVIKRMIVNHNATGEIYITTDDASPICAAVKLREYISDTDKDPNVSAASYKNLVSYLIAAKLSNKKIQLYTDPNCQLFRAEIID